MEKNKPSLVSSYQVTLENAGCAREGEVLKILLGKVSIP